MSVAVWEYVGDAGTGTFTQSSGSNNFGGSFSGGLFVSYAGGNGTYNLSGGQLIGGFADNEYVGYSAGAAGPSTSWAESTLTMYGSLYLGYFNTGSNGAYALSGGSLHSTTYVGWSGTGYFTQSGGTNNGSVYLGYNSNSGGTYNLNRWAPECERDRGLGGNRCLHAVRRNYQCFE